jgi:hypothetical protein
VFLPDRGPQGRSERRGDMCRDEEGAWG